MTYLPGYAALVLGVLVLARVCADAADWFAGGGPPRYLRLLARETRPAPEPLPLVAEELELTRLARELARVRDARQPGLRLRLRAVTMAYDEALMRCAARLGVGTPQEPPPLPEATRFDLETTLMSRGLNW